MTDVSRCKSCHEPIRWVRINGRPMPVDYFPRADGSVFVMANGNARVLPVAERARSISPLYVSHFATCRNAAAHRRAR